MPWCGCRCRCTPEPTPRFNGDVHPYATTAAAGLAGLAVWSLTEYATHRASLHPTSSSAWARLGVDRQHRAHHEDPLHTSRLARTAGYLTIGAVAAGAAPLLRRKLPASVAHGLAAGWAVGYGIYDSLHWHAHHAAPRTAWGLRMRRRHFRHHFGGPQTNFGVTMSWWDQLLGTEANAAPARLAARRAPAWMTDDSGHLRKEFVNDFVLVHG